MSLRDQLLVADTPAEIADVIDQYVQNEIVRAVTDPSTGAVSLAGAGGANFSIAMKNGFVRKGRAAGGNYGRRIATWADTPLQNSGGTAALVTNDLPPMPDGSTRALKLTRNATASFGQQICTTSDYTSPSAAVEGMGLWVKNPSSASLSCQLQIYNAAADHDTSWNFVVDPCDWTFLTIAPHSNISNTFVWGTDAIHFVRISQWTVGDVWPVGAECLFGPVYVGTKGRARFMLCTDDGIKSIFHPENITSGWPASGRSYREIVESYGFKGTLYIVPNLIGTTGYLTQSELLKMQDLGWAIGSHSYTHPAYSNRGLTSLGPVGYADVNDTYHARATNDDSAIYADVMRGVEELSALGIHNADHLFALPQGTWDAYVRSALMRTGIKHIRAISSYNNFNTITMGRPSGGGNTGSSLLTGGWIHQGDAVQTDGTLTVANCQAYVDDCIAYGATGANYHHGLSTTNAAVLDGLCAYLKTKQDAGLIEVVTASQAAWDDGCI